MGHLRDAFMGTGSRQRFLLGAHPQKASMSSPSCAAQAEKSVTAQAVLEGKVAVLCEMKHNLVLRTNPIPQMLPAWCLNGFQDCTDYRSDSSMEVG